MKWMLEKRKKDGWDFPSLFSNFFEEAGNKPFIESGWSPSLDISENENEYTVKVDVPGVDPKELNISLKDEVLTISGEKKVEHEEKKENYHRIERSYGSFSRTVKLPYPVEAERISANSKDGVLTVRIPKREEAKEKKIDVKTE